MNNAHFRFFHKKPKLVPSRKNEASAEAPADCYGVQIKGFLLGWFDGLVVQAQETLFCPGCPGQPNTKYFFPHRTLFQSMFPHRSGTLAGRRAGSPVSVSLSSSNLGM
jgi:hypothetical protein